MSGLVAITDRDMADITDTVYEKAYRQGRADMIEQIKAIIEESGKMMWHSDKTLEKIKEQLKEQK